MVIKTKSVQETESIGAQFASQILNEKHTHEFVALFGDLGVGKTAFTRGFVSQIAPNVIVKSPTYTLVNEYRGNMTSVFHFDMYRIESEDDLYSIGFDDYLNRKGICICEWSEKIPFALPKEYWKVTIQKDFENPNYRSIEIEAIHP